MLPLELAVSTSFGDQLLLIAVSVTESMAESLGDQLLWVAEAVTKLVRVAGSATGSDGVGEPRFARFVCRNCE